MTGVVANGLRILFLVGLVVSVAWLTYLTWATRDNA